MVKCNDWPIGICSWPLGDNIKILARLRQELGIEYVHLNSLPLLNGNKKKYLSSIKKQEWNISSLMVSFPQEDYSTLESIKISGGIIPAEYWLQNKKIILDSIELASELSVQYISFHAGFIGHKNNKTYNELRDRMLSIADSAHKKKVMILMETGQETANDLCNFLEELNHPAIGINLDPANMILYDKGDPIEALKTLSKWIKHVHIKDAVHSEVTGKWGTEVLWGTGEVNDKAFLSGLKNIGYTGILAIEREAGDNRLEDIKLTMLKLIEFKG